jgi:hypothetical protein
MVYNELKPETTEALNELIKLDKDFEKHLQKLLKLRKEKPALYMMAIVKLNWL